MLAVPELSLPSPDAARLHLVRDGALCIPLGDDGLPWLHARGEEQGMVFPLALGIAGGDWAIVG